MKPKHRRLVMVMGALMLMAVGTGIVLTAMRDTMIFFYTPTQLHEKQQSPAFNAQQPLRIGGLVKKGSVKNLSEGGLRFTVTDLARDTEVTYRGLVPSLFREGQGVVAQGKLGTDGGLIADSILAKHDENYMPREVMDALKKSGRWNDHGTYANEPRP